MLLKLFLCFTLIPVLELYLLIRVGESLGGMNTLLLVIATGFFGAWLARLEGMGTMLRVRASLQQGIMPAEELLDAVIILVAGLLLVTPGLLTDAVGLLLLCPVTRGRFKAWLRKKFEKMTSDGTLTINRFDG
jgi:UPF0716 protein FxsA